MPNRIRVAVCTFAAFGLVACGAFIFHIVEITAVRPAVPDEPKGDEIRAIFIADNQQREIFGHISALSSQWAQVSKVAIRSSEQDLFGKYVVREISDLESEAAPRSMIFHLGDALDYSCESEWVSVSSALDAASFERLFITPGNHDGQFQGNNDYGWALSAGLFFSGKSVKLEAHHNDVCRPQNEPDTKRFSFYKRDFVCAYLKEKKFAGFSLSDTVIERCENLAKRRENPRDKEFRKLSVEIEKLSLSSISPLINKGELDARMSIQFENPSAFIWSPGYLLQTIKLPLKNDEPPVHVVLMDSTHWNGEPSYRGFVDGTNNPRLGEINTPQRGEVEAYLAKITGPALVVLGSHYSFDQLQDETRRWMKGLIAPLRERRIGVIYISGHTHNGFIVRPGTDNNELREINVDSLIDSPVSYLTMVRKDKQYCFIPRDAWRQLKCEQTVATDVEAEAREIVLYRKNAEYGFLDLGSSQWRNRANDACRALRIFAPDSSCRDLPFYNWSSFDKTENIGEIASAMTLLRDDVDKKLQNSSKERRKAACLSLLGAANFEERPPKKRPHEPLEKECVDDL